MSMDGPAPDQASNSVSAGDHSVSEKRGQDGPSEMGFWLSSWLGTTASGGVFGGLVGCAPGVIFGVLFAGLVGIIVHAVMAVVVWSLFLPSRFRLAWASLAGGTTGLVSTMLLLDEFQGFPGSLLAGVFGTIGAGIGGACFTRRAGSFGTSVGVSKTQDQPIPRGEIIRRLALFVVVVATVTAVVLQWQQGRERLRKQHCHSMLKMVSLALSSYDSTYRSLPPAYLTGPNGEPVLSWRILTARHFWYDHNFQKEMDFSQPWDSPKNAAFLKKFHPAGVFQCPAARNEESPITHYVAVVGPETLWPGAKPAKLPKESESRKPILVVEWPDSNIHWAEPRDVTVEEFLDWFRRKPARSRGLHRTGIQYIDSSGQAGEIPHNAEPEEVLRLLRGE